MASMQFGTVFKAPVITASSEVASHPATNIGLYMKWRRTWRSVNASAQTVVFDFGAATTVTGVFLNYVNFATFTLESSSNGSTWTAITSQSMAKDERVDRYKRWVPSSVFSPGFNHRYMRLSLAPGTIFTGDAFFQIGAIAFPTATNFDDCFGTPWTWTPRQAVTRSEFPGGGADVNIEGPTRLAYELVGGPWLTSKMPQMLTIHQLEQTGPLW